MESQDVGEGKDELHCPNNRLSQEQWKVRMLVTIRKYYIVQILVFTQEQWKVRMLGVSIGF